MKDLRLRAIDLPILIVVIITVVYTFNVIKRERKRERNLLTRMKEHLFPQLLNNLKELIPKLKAKTVENLEMIAQTKPAIQDIQLNREGRILLFSFKIYFHSLGERLKAFREKLAIYNEKYLLLSKSPETIGLRKELEKLSEELEKETTSLIAAIEPLMELEKLPPRRIWLHFR